jgi:hypothetical protein
MMLLSKAHRVSDGSPKNEIKRSLLLGLIDRVKSFNTESDKPDFKDGSETSSGGMKVAFEAGFAYDTTVVLTF